MVEREVILKMGTHTTSIRELVKFFLTILGFIVIHSIIPTTNAVFYFIRFLVGFFVLFYVPGLCLSKIFCTIVELKNAGFFVIFGIVFQVLNVFILWFFHFFYHPFDFGLIIYSLTFCFILLTTSYLYKRHSFINFRTYISPAGIDRTLLLIVILAFALRMFFQASVPTPNSDGAAFMVYARSLKNGMFGGENSIGIDCPICQTGYHQKIATYFVMALFYLVGDVSFFTTKLWLIIGGTLTIFPVYVLTKEFFNENAAKISSLIVAIHPLYSFYSILPSGSEVPGALFFLTVFYILIKALKEEVNLRNLVLAGIILSIGFYVRLYNYYLLIVTFPVAIFLLVYLKEDRFSRSSIMLSLGLSVLWITYVLTTTFLDIVAVLLIIFSMAIFKYGDRMLTRTATFFLTTYFFLLSVHLTTRLIPTVAANIPTPLENIETQTSLVRQVFNFSTLPTGLDYYWGKHVYPFLGSIFAFLAFLSFSRIKKWRNSLLLGIFPIAESIFLYQLMGRVWPQGRYILFSSFFLVILSASSLDMIASYAKSEMKKNATISIKVFKKKICINPYTIFITIIFLSCIIPVLRAPYDESLSKMDQANQPERTFWKPAMSWVNENLNIEDIVAVCGTSYWCWYCPNTTFTRLAPDSIDLNDLMLLIKEYQINYIVVDHDFYLAYENLKALYSNPEFTPVGFSLVFHSENQQSGRHTSIYNVTTIIHGTIKKLYYVISTCDSEMNWSLIFGNGSLNLNELDKKEGNCSLEAYGKADNFGTFAVLYDPKTLVNLSDYEHIEFWIKSNVSSALYVYIVDSAGNQIGWDPNRATTYLLTVSDKWTHFELPLKLMIGNPPTVKDSRWNETQIDKIYIGVSTVPNGTISIWIDELFASKNIIEEQ